MPIDSIDDLREHVALAWRCRPSRREPLTETRRFQGDPMEEAAYWLTRLVD